jgi:predicted RNA-binding protein associated with RNAse of E/G family
VVADDDDLIAFYTPAGVLYKGPGDRQARLSQSGEWQLVDGIWTGRFALWLAEPGAAHAVIPFRSVSGALDDWYVNLQEPLRRTSRGFDSVDLLLDIVVSPDLSNWRWDDEDELAEAVSRGLLSADVGREVREEGERVIERVRRKLAPFGTGWDRWTPNPDWPPPKLPDDWCRLD